LVVDVIWGSVKKFFEVKAPSGDLAERIRKNREFFKSLEKVPIPPANVNAEAEKKQKTKSVSNHDPKKEFLRIFKKLTYMHSPWSVFFDFVTMAACALSNPLDKSNFDKREEAYLRIIKKYQKDDQSLFPELFAEVVTALELNPDQDFLGDIYSSLDLTNRAKGQFFTPYNICRLMAAPVMGNVSPEIMEKGYITINDPCCEAGAILISAANEARKQLAKENLNFQNHILISAQDVDETVAMMCYIQLSLLGVAGYVKVGNSLTEPMSSDDSLEDYWFTPMYFSDVWSTRRLVKRTDSILKEE
jgi:type I restriction-modification system DNA methylase subunit